MKGWPGKSLRVVVGTLVAIACGGTSTSDGEGNGNGDGGTGAATSGGASGTTSTGAMSTGGSPTGGTAGTPASGGDAGTAPNGGFAGVLLPTGGDAGMAPTGGSAGAGMTGGSGGSGGSAGGGRECETADDCVMFSDCCNCAAVPEGTSMPVCERLCITDQCTAQQIGRDEVTCRFGRCLIDRTCDHARATCDSSPEPCPSGQVRSVTDDGCWGPCLPPTECRDVSDCADCGAALCVAHAAMPPGLGCVVPEPSCTKGNYCDCLGACPLSDAFDCYEDVEAVICYCLAC